MALTFIDLVNDVNQRVNETELTASNFNTSQGHYKNAKQAVNSSIDSINLQQFEWPFNHVTYSENLTAGINRYAYQADVKSVDYDSFRIRRNNTFGNKTVWLRPTSYEEYLKYGIDDEYNSDTTVRRLPELVFPTPDEGYGVWPVPKEDYTLDFEYYLVPVPLVSPTDTTNLPDIFRHVIVDGAVYYTYLFREDYENADRLYQKFEDGIGALRKIFINRSDDMKSTTIVRNRRPTATLGNYF